MLSASAESVNCVCSTCAHMLWHSMCTPPPQLLSWPSAGQCNIIVTGILSLVCLSLPCICRQVQSWGLDLPIQSF
jgi:hypothetical protein